MLNIAIIFTSVVIFILMLIVLYYFIDMDINVLTIVGSILISILLSSILYNKHLKNKSDDIHSVNYDSKIFGSMGWTTVENNGRNNSGIQVDPEHPYALKKYVLSDSDIEIWNRVYIINKDSPGIFPVVVINKDEKSVVMEKFDGDLSEYIYVKSAEKIAKDFPNSEDLLLIYKEKLDHANGKWLELGENWMLNEDKRLRVKQFDKAVNNVGLEGFLQFYIKVKSEILLRLDEAYEKIIILQRKLNKIGYKFTSAKYDNFAYRIRDNSLKVVFIDPESGLHTIGNKEFSIPKFKMFIKFSKPRWFELLAANFDVKDNKTREYLKELKISDDSIKLLSFKSDFGNAELMKIKHFND